MAFECKQCGKTLGIVRYRQLTTFCCIKCARAWKHNLNRQRIGYMKKLEEDNKMPEKPAE